MSFMRQMYFCRDRPALTFISPKADIRHPGKDGAGIDLKFIYLSTMFLSKSFGYALRGVLYVALVDQEGRKVQLDEMARKLSVPRHFLAKIMKTMVKEGILHSTKGPYGGFSLNESTLKTKLITLVKITDGVEQFNTCVLSLRKCNSQNPCPLHYQMLKLRDDMLAEFSARNLDDLLDEKNPDFIKSISAIS